MERSILSITFVNNCPIAMIFGGGMEKNITRKMYRTDFSNLTFKGQKRSLKSLNLTFLTFAKKV